MKQSNHQNSASVRVAPNNQEAEAAVLGACLTTPAIISQIEEVLDPEDCYREAHVALLGACYALRESCDLVTAVDYLNRKGILDKIGGQEYIIKLATETVTSSGWRYWANIIRDCATRRKLMNQCQATFQACHDFTKELPEALIEHEKAIQGIEQGCGQRLKRGVHISNVYTPDRMLKAYSDYVEKLKDNQFVTGLERIDKLIRGVGGGEVMFIIARAGSFKTATLQNMLLNYRKTSERSAVFFSLEMPVASLTERYHEIVSGFKGREIEGIYGHPDEAELRDRIERDFIEDMDRIFVIPTKVGLKDLVSYVNLIETNFRTKVGLLGIDYLGLMDEPGKEEYQIITNLSRGLKDTAKLLDIPIVCLSQTSRKGGEGETEITLDMGRGSGAIEENADVALGIWQNKTDDDMEGGEIILKILKNRKGAKGSRWLLDLDKETLKLSPTCYPWEPPKTKGRKKVVEA